MSGSGLIAIGSGTRPRWVLRLMEAWPAPELQLSDQSGAAFSGNFRGSDCSNRPLVYFVHTSTSLYLNQQAPPFRKFSIPNQLDRHVSRVRHSLTCSSFIQFSATPPRGITAHHGQAREAVQEAHARLRVARFPPTVPAPHHQRRASRHHQGRPDEPL